MLITDIRMPEMNGVDVLREAKRIDPEITSIVMTAFASTDTAVEALRLGAADYVNKSPGAANELRMRVRKELERKRLQQENVLLKRALHSTHQFSNIIGSSGPMLAIFQLIETVAPTASTVLITGESGTGKELVARAIHVNSPRKDRPFVALNCGAVSETLLDSELFGHMRGAFTGADVNKKGLIEVAEKGTIFLDEIGEMSPQVQVKLLRVLQERRFRRVGGTDEVEADIRIIAATNRDLSKMVGGRNLPRRPVLPHQRDSGAAAAAARAGGRHPAARGTLRVEICRPDGEARLGSVGSGHGMSAGVSVAREHPGARERNRAGCRARAESRRFWQRACPTPSGRRLLSLSRPPPPPKRFPSQGFDLEQHVQHIEREYIAEALRRAGGVKVKAADLLGMSFRSFRYYMKKYNLK